MLIIKIIAELLGVYIVRKNGNCLKFEAKLLSDYCRKRIFVSELLSKKTYIMATLSLTILPAKALKGGRHKVRIAVAHNSQTRYIVTDVVIDSAKEWKNGQVVKRGDSTYLNAKLLKRLNELQRIVDDIPYVEGLSCAELVDTITQSKERQSRTIASAFEEMMEVSPARPSTIYNYRVMFRSITSVIPASTLVRNITPLMVRRFVKKRGEELKPCTIQQQISLLSQLLNFCQRNGYSDFRFLPTDGCYQHVVAVRQNWLSPDQIRFIRDTDFKLRSERKFRDLFMLSYYLGGINMIDLAQINFNECMDTIKYVRSKTETRSKINPFVEFDVPDEAKAIIKRYIKKDGRLSISKTTVCRYSEAIGQTARKMRASYDLPNMTFYSARKSFAQHAFALGEKESVIDYILGHSLGSSGNKMLFAYVKVTPDMATACVRKVCDFIASTRNF